MAEVTYIARGRRRAGRRRSCSRPIQQIEVEDHADLADMLRLRLAVAVERGRQRLDGCSTTACSPGSQNVQRRAEGRAAARPSR